MTDIERRLVHADNDIQYLLSTVRWLQERVEDLQRPRPSTTERVTSFALEHSIEIGAAIGVILVVSLIYILGD